MADGVKVYDPSTQQEVTVSSEEAQEAYTERRAALSGGTQRVAKGGTVLEVPNEQVTEAITRGYRLVDEEETQNINLHNEESDLGSTIQAGAEATAAGLSLGTSTWLLDALGVDAERMAIRREELGDVGTTLEIAGAVLPSAMSGGGGLASFLSKTPAGMVARGGARLEAGIARHVGDGTISRILPGAARNFFEGTAQGAGAEVDESVLGGRDLAADRIASQGFLSGLFGAGVGAAIPGLAAVASGAERGSVKGMQKVLGRMNASTGGMATEEAAEMLIRSDASSLSDDAVKFWARSVGMDEAVAMRLKARASTPEGRAQLNDAFRKSGVIEQDAAELVGGRLNSINENLTNVRMAATGSAKAKEFDRLIPEAAEHVAPRATDEAFMQLRGHVDEMIQENKLNPYGANLYDAPMLKEADQIMRRLEAGLTEAEQLAGKSRASRKAIAMDQAKRELGNAIDNSGGWGKPKFGIAPTVSATNTKLKQVYEGIRDHLEKEDLFGAAAVAQKQINAAYRKEAAAIEAFQDEQKGTLIGKIFNADGTVNARKAVQIVRQFGKTGGDITLQKLDDVLEARLEYMRTVRKNYDLDDVVKKQIDDVERSVKELRSDFKGRAEMAGIVDDLEHARIAEGNRSPSIGLLSSVGPSALGFLGFGLGGPIGAAAGLMAGAVTRPYSTLKTFSSIMSLVDKADLGQAQAIGRISKAIASGSSKAGKPSSGIGRAAMQATAVHTKSEMDERRERALAAASHLNTSPEALARAMDVPLYDVNRVAPGVASVLTQRAQTAAQYLQSKAPRIYTRPFSNKKLVDPLSAASFDRTLRTIQDPIGTLNDIADGNVTAEQAEALRVVYPALYEDVQQQIDEALVEAGDRGHEVPFEMRVKLGLFYKTPTDPSISPESQGAIQAAIGGAGPAQEMPGGGAGQAGRPSKIDINVDSLKTDADSRATWRSLA
jgi:hypothetical protein